MAQKPYRPSRLKQGIIRLNCVVCTKRDVIGVEIFTSPLNTVCINSANKILVSKYEHVYTPEKMLEHFKVEYAYQKLGDFRSRCYAIRSLIVSALSAVARVSMRNHWKRKRESNTRSKILIRYSKCYCTCDSSVTQKLRRTVSIHWLRLCNHYNFCKDFVKSRLFRMAGVAKC